MSDTPPKKTCKCGRPSCPHPADGYLPAYNNGKADERKRIIEVATKLADRTNTPGDDPAWVSLTDLIAAIQEDTNDE